MTRVFIGVGSNINPEENVRQAISLLGCEVNITAISTFYLTEALERPDHPPFYNGVLEAQTDLSLLELKHLLKSIESKLGRRHNEDGYAPREIDLDILLYDDQADSIDPDIRTRLFLAIPLCELSPGLILPDSGERIKEIADSLSGNQMQPLCEYTRQLLQLVYGDA